MKPRRRPWTAEETALLRRLYPDTTPAVLAAELQRSDKQIYYKAGRLGLKKSAGYMDSHHAVRLREGVGDATRFKPGSAPWNKGKPFQPGGRSAETRFKPGHVPASRNPLGHERVSKEGYLERKVSETGVTRRDYRPVHHLVWREAGRDIPPGHALIFRDGDKRNFDLANLEIVSRSELMARNTVHRLPKEIAHVVQLRGAINRQINKRQRNTP